MPQPFSRASALVATVSVVLAVAAPALAGPPLLCHPFDIGPATSLPWRDGSQWRGMRADYDLSRLTGDTVALLTPSTPILVRMETLRRAALYASTDRGAASSLLDTLLARARTAAGGPAGEAALAEFDAGYLIESYRQTSYENTPTVALVARLDGYKMVVHALETRHEDPAIAFAAALMTMGPRKADYPEHVKRARAGANADTLLARNIDHLPQ